MEVADILNLNQFGSLWAMTQDFEMTGNFSCGCLDPDGYTLVSSLSDPSPCLVSGFAGNLLTVSSFFWMLATLVKLRKEKNINSKASPMFLIKFGLIALQLVFQVILLKSISFNVKSSIWWFNFINMFSLHIALLLTYVENYKSYIAQSPLLIFWSGNFILGMLRTVNTSLRNNSPFQTFVTLSYGINSLMILLTELNFSPKLSLDPTKKFNIYDYSNLFSKLAFTWMTPLMQLGHEKFLIQSDLPPLPSTLKTDNLSNILSQNWNSQVHKQSLSSPSLFSALCKSFGFPFLIAGIFKFIQDCIAFIQPQLLKHLIIFVHDYNLDRSIPLTKGFMIVAAMFSLSVLQTASLHQYFERVLDTGIKVKASLTSLIYQKSLNLSIEAKQQKSTGDIVNLMSVDTQRLQDLCQNLQLIWSGPFQMILCLVSLYNLLGNAMWVGVFILAITVPLNTSIFKYQKTLQKAQMKVKDERTGLISEILNNIKSLKLYAWENPYKAKLNHVRNEKELKNLKKIGIFQAGNQFIFNSTPFMVSCSTFALFIVAYNGKPLSTDIVFTALSLFNLLGFPLMALPWTIGNVIESQVALERLSEFLASDEIEEDIVSHLPAAKSNGDISVEISKADFLWTRTPYKTALVDINYQAKKGELNCILGRVGSGKSAMLQALLGDLHKPKGHVSVKGTIAYVPQNAWIMNGTIKENILFGCKLDDDFYAKTLKACALESDLDIFPDGDSTQVGEKGISLSGGQKARLSLARAVYSRADVYLLDDILSAVDEHVGRHLINNVIGPTGLLNSKCKILATNSISVLKYSDVITMLDNGRIIEESSYNSVMNDSSKGDKLHDLIMEFGKTNKKSENKEESPKLDTGLESAELTASASSVSVAEEIKLLASKEIPKAELEDFEMAIQEKTKIEQLAGRDEKHEQGKVDWSVYFTYANACGIKNVVIFVVFIILSMTLSVSGNVWLKYWSEINTKYGYNPEPWKYLGIYFALCFFAAFFTMCQSLVQWLLCSISGSKYLHEIMLASVLRAPMQFFETTPIGRILNRFSNDIYKVDEQLFRVFGMFFNNIIKVSFTMMVIIYSTWQFLFFIVPLFFIYKYYQQFYLFTSRELRRLDSVSRSPIFAHFQETLTGVSTIRAYDQIDRFLFLNRHKMDSNMAAYHPSVSSNRWLAVRLEFLGSLIILASSGLLILTLKSGHVTSGLVGLSVSYALQITQSLNWIVRMTVDIESNIVSVERIIEYSKLESEAPEIIENKRPGMKWPFNGAIEFKNYSTRYRSDLDLVLKDINLSIQKQEKIGIVGRTGAGKSSLTLAIFRIIEPSNGNIEIDEINTSDIGLYDLRSKLSIIPQDSQIFQGTIRANLDPTDQYTDSDVWTALKLSHLNEHVMAMYEEVEDKQAIENNPLLVQLSEGGSNLSAGQKQLMCLARALTRKDSKVLVLDEATANVDFHTDKIVQETIRSAFKDRTILTIAHRLNTIIDSDKIIVLERGQVKEFDTPSKLLEDKEGLFYSLCLEGGLVPEEKQ